MVSTGSFLLVDSVSADLVYFCWLLFKLIGPKTPLDLGRHVGYFSSFGLVFTGC